MAQFVDQLRTIIFECLKERAPRQHLESSWTVSHLCDQVAKFASKQQLQFQGSNAWHIGQRNQQPDLHPHLARMVRDATWDLIIEGILRPGSHVDSISVSEYSCPFIHLTPYGADVVNGITNPYDPEGYTRYLQQLAPTADQAIVDYISESARALRANCLLSSTMTMGLASEKAILLIIDAFSTALGAADKTQFDSEIDAQKMIKPKYDKFMDWFTAKKKRALVALTSQIIFTQFEDALRFLFPYFRDLRNAAGHPSAFVFEREQVHGNLIIFPGYLKRLCELMVLLGTTTNL